MQALENFLREVECYDQKWFDAIGGHWARQELQALNDLHKAMDYYRASVLHVRPSFVPKLIRLPASSPGRSGEFVRACRNLSGHQQPLGRSQR